jgi:hypothetical protein
VSIKGKTIQKLILLLLAVSLLGGCAGKRPMTGGAAPDVDRKLSAFAFIEDGALIDLIVGTRPTRFRENESYIPFEIAIANRKLKQLTLTRESFVLMDETGNRYPCASPRELLEGYEFLDLDRNPILAELIQIILTKYAAFSRYPSNFSPTRGVDLSRRGTVRDMISLPKFGYFIDMLYFPTPPGGVKGHLFEIHVTSPDLVDPIFVKFEVR